MGWWGLDRLAAHLYAQQRPRLEQQLTRVMGHPLQLGPYRGLRPWGLAAGASRFLPGPENPSSVEVAGVALALDPLRSLLQRAWVLQIDLQDARVELRRNSRGLYWQLPDQPPGREPPPLQLRFRLLQQARLQLQPAAGRPLPLQVQGTADLQLQRRAIAVQGRLRPPSGGDLGFALDGHWQQQRWQLALRPRQLSLQPLLPLLPPPLQRLQGRIQGTVLLQRRSGQNRCQGGLRLEQVRWQLPALSQPLQAPLLDLRCDPRGVQLTPSAVTLGPWQGRLDGDLARSGALRLQLEARERQQGHRLLARLSGPWQQPQLRLDGQWQGLRLGSLPVRPLQLQAQLGLRFGKQAAVAVPWLRVQRDDALISASGQLWPQLQLRTRQLRLGQALQPSLGALLGPAPQLQAVLQQRGGWRQPQLQLDLSQHANPLLGHWLARLLWRPGLLQLERLQAPELTASGSLPLTARPSLQLRFDLQRFPLSRLSRLIGSRLRGQLDAWGEVRGPLQQLQPDLQLLVREPGVGPLWLAETWQGRLKARRVGGADLQLQALVPALPASLQARLDARWLPSQVQLQREQGLLTFSGTPRRYQWQVRAFPLEGLQLALGPRSLYQPLQGDLSGQGLLDLQPLWIQGSVQVHRPQLLAFQGQSLELDGVFRQRRYSVKGSWHTARQGAVALQLKGEQAGPLWARFEARRLGSEPLRQLLQSWPRWRGGPLPIGGTAADLGPLVIAPLGESLSVQLEALRQAQERLAAVLPPAITPRSGLDAGDLAGDLDALLDADLTLSGDHPERLFLDLAARGHLWRRGQDRDLALSRDPLQVQLRGPLSDGGQFSVQHLPLALLALLTPVPEGLRGGLALQGRYSLPRGSRRADLALQLSLQDAALLDQPLQLERGAVELRNAALHVDVALRGGTAQNSVELKGAIPLTPQADSLELRLASRGDGLQFLSVLGGQGVQWQRGSTDLQLLVRGSLQEPLANGFLRFRDGVLQVGGQTLRDLEAIVLFDFRELELQQLKARVGERGELSGGGQLGLFQPMATTARPLLLQVSRAPFRLPRMQGQADGQVQVGGSLLRPELSGELQLSRGSINVQPGQLATEAEPERPVTLPELVEARWDFRQPLVLMGQQQESTASRDLRAAVPRLGFLQFRDLRLRFGPDLRVSVPNVLNFNTKGLLTLSGPLDPSIRISGVIRLLNGRLSLFTTAFSLDPDAPNVAVFTPSLGLIPYVDIALRTRVSDTLAINQNTDRSSIYDWNAVTPFSSVDQLRLVKVRLEAAGPADRLADNIRLTSSPPLPESRLVALIGGNTLVGLVGGNAATALATVLGQSLLSPLVGGLSDAFGQRLTFALYPTYFVPAETSAQENRSRRLPSQLVLGSEIGLDLTERFNFSVLAAPNRSDIPPQMTLRYQASDRIGVQGSVDAEGRWQTQLQMLLRF